MEEFKRQPTLDIKIPFTTETLASYLQILREFHDADAVYGRDMCGKVNTGLVSAIKHQIPNVNCLTLVCEDNQNLRFSGGRRVEHQVGVLLLEDRSFWWDGTGDQLSLRVPTIIVHEVFGGADVVIADLKETIGGTNWHR